MLSMATSSQQYWGWLWGNGVCHRGIAQNCQKGMDALCGCNPDTWSCFVYDSVIRLRFRSPLAHVPTRQVTGFVRVILPLLKPATFGPGDLVTTPKVGTREMSFIVHGEVEVRIRSSSRNQVPALFEPKACQERILLCTFNFRCTF